MEELRNKFARDINKVLELSKSLLKEDELKNLRDKLLQNAESELQSKVNAEKMKLNEIVK
tara:strand:- start:264 stop:443 length:180 start_codon:yes stop_codon:yes gene_type:complete